VPSVREKGQHFGFQQKSDGNEERKCLTVIAEQKMFSVAVRQNDYRLRVDWVTSLEKS